MFFKSMCKAAIVNHPMTVAGYSQRCHWRCELSKREKSN